MNYVIFHWKRKGSQEIKSKLRNFCVMCVQSLFSYFYIIKVSKNFFEWNVKEQRFGFSICMEQIIIETFDLITKTTLTEMDSNALKTIHLMPHIFHKFFFHFLLHNWIELYYEIRIREREKNPRSKTYNFISLESFAFIVFGLMQRNTKKKTEKAYTKKLFELV